MSKMTVKRCGGVPTSLAARCDNYRHLVSEGSPRPKTVRCPCPPHPATRCNATVSVGEMMDYLFLRDCLELRLATPVLWSLQRQWCRGGVADHGSFREGEAGAWMVCGTGC